MRSEGRLIAPNATKDGHSFRVGILRLHAQDDNIKAQDDNIKHADSFHDGVRAGEGAGERAVWFYFVA